MKKFLILILTTLVFAVADAQIFTQKEIRDKFNDIISKREIKTLITKNDTAIIIEEKGNEPVTYKVLFEFDSKGSEDNIVRLVDDVYGYEKSWIVVLDEYRCAITHRVVTDKYGTEFVGEFYWIAKLSKNGNYERTIYSKIY